MELIKKSERTVTVASCINTYKVIGAEINNCGTFKKWKELKVGGRITVSLTVYKVCLNNDCWYMIGDTLGKVCFSGKVEWSEINNWLSEKGYQTEHDFYISDGMSEEDWNAWNGSEN